MKLNLEPFLFPIVFSAIFSFSRYWEIDLPYYLNRKETSKEYERLKYVKLTNTTKSYVGQFEKAINISNISGFE